MTARQPPEPSQAEIRRGAGVLLQLLDWKQGFGNEEAVRSLREAKLDVAIVSITKEGFRVHAAVLKVFCDLAAHSVVWDSAKENCRTRRRDDPA